MLPKIWKAVEHGHFRKRWRLPEQTNIATDVFDVLEQATCLKCELRDSWSDSCGQEHGAWGNGPEATLNQHQ
jgi:hypothetical protein